MKTLYDLIGARQDDDAESLKKAYRQAVKASHPDYHTDDPGAVRRFTQITAAYHILRDTELRVAYDQSLESCHEPPNATLKHTPPPQRHFFISSMSVSAPVTLMLSGAFLLFAGVSGVSIEDMVVRRAPQANATAAVQPVVPQMPVVVTGPSVATSTSQDGSPSEKTTDGTASQETKDWTGSTETQNTAPSKETTDRPASQETPPTQVGRPIHLAEPNVDMDLINRSPVPEKHDGVRSSESHGRWLAKRHRGSDMRTDARTRDRAFAETLPRANKPASKADSKSGDTLAEPNPDSFRLGPLCLSVNPTACPIGGNERRR